MKLKLNVLIITGVAFMAFSTAMAETTEVTVNLLSTIKKQGLVGGDTFNVSFGSLNGGLLDLASKPVNANGAAGFATWYGANSRTLLNWNGVNGSLVTDSEDYYRYYGLDTSVSTRAGGPLTSIFSSTLNNRALAFVTWESSPGSGIEQIGLFDLGFDWGNGADTEQYPLGLYDAFTLSSDAVAIYGSTNPSDGDFGSLTTSSVPEPSSASLLLLGSLALAAVRRFRKNV